MTGQLITSFLVGKVSPTMTSTTCSQCVELAMEGNKTGYCSGSHGGALDTNSPRVKTGGIGRVVNDLLPFNLRPIKARRRRIRPRYGWGAELYAFKRVWHSHHKPRIKQMLAKLSGITK